MKAGRELDMLVAEKVLGWKRGHRYANGNGEWIFPEDGPRHFRTDWDGTPGFSTNIAAAWIVVEHMVEIVDGCVAAKTMAFAHWWNESSLWGHSAAEAAEAICIAAIEAAAQ